MNTYEIETHTFTCTIKDITLLGAIGKFMLSCDSEIVSIKKMK